MHVAYVCVSMWLYASCVYVWILDIHIWILPSAWTWTWIHIFFFSVVLCRDGSKRERESNGISCDKGKNADKFSRIKQRDPSQSLEKEEKMRGWDRYYFSFYIRSSNGKGLYTVYESLQVIWLYELLDAQTRAHTAQWNGIFLGSRVERSLAN